MTGPDFGGMQPQGFVLAGGRSRRMGCDKAMLVFDGAPLIEHALAKLQTLGLTPQILGSRPDLAKYAPVIEDLHPGCGPLGGIEAALTASKSELNLFIPVDLPLLPVPFLRWMLARAGITWAPATIPLLHGRPQPLCSVLRRDRLANICRALDQGNFKVLDALASRDMLPGRAVTSDLFNVEAIAPTRRDWPLEPPVHLWFQNLNRPGDLQSLRLNQSESVASYARFQPAR